MALGLQERSLAISISFDSVTNMTVVRLGQGTAGIASFDNYLLFKNIKDDLPEIHEDTVGAADIRIVFGNLDNVRCIRDRLNEIEAYLINLNSEKKEF